MKRVDRRRDQNNYEAISRVASALTRTEGGFAVAQTGESLLEWLGLSRFSSRLNIARIYKGSSRTEGVR